MTPIEQIKKLAGNFVFNQVLYPRDSFLSDAFLNQDENIDPWLEIMYGNYNEKINFASTWCLKHPGNVLDLSNNSGDLAINLVKQGTEVSVLENSSTKLSQMREAKENLDSQQKSKLHIYPLEINKLELDETFQNAFVSHHILEQAESEIAILGTLRKIIAHLESEANIFIELHNLDYFENRNFFREALWHYASLPIEKQALGRLWERTFPGSKDSQTIFEYAVSDRFNQFSLHRSTIHLFNLDQWMKLFEVAGLIVEECFGGWRQSVITSQHPIMTFYLKRK